MTGWRLWGGAPPLRRVGLRPHRPAAAALRSTGRVASAARVARPAGTQAGQVLSTGLARRDGAGGWAAVAPRAAMAGGVTGERRCGGRPGARARLPKPVGWAGPWREARLEGRQAQAPHQWARPPRPARRVAVGRGRWSPGPQGPSAARLPGEHGRYPRPPRVGTHSPWPAPAPPGPDAGPALVGGAQTPGGA